MNRLKGMLCTALSLARLTVSRLKSAYFQAFALGEGVSVEGIDDGSAVFYTYRAERQRPVLISLTAK
jgi:hypothetical protein